MALNIEHKQSTSSVVLTDNEWHIIGYPKYGKGIEVISSNSIVEYVLVHKELTKAELVDLATATTAYTNFANNFISSPDFTNTSPHRLGNGLSTSQQVGSNYIIFARCSGRAIVTYTNLIPPDSLLK